MRKKAIFFIIICITCLAIIVFGYKSFLIKSEQEKIFSITNGNFSYLLSSKDLNNKRSIIVKPGDIKIVNLTITSLNQSDTNYKIYYQASSNEKVKVSYYKNQIYNGIGTLTKNEKNEIQVLIENNSDKDVTIQFGIQGESIDKILTLDQGLELKELQNNIELAYNYNGSNPPDGFPSKDSGYVVTGVECKNATGNWNNDKWAVTITSIKESGAICTVNFEDKKFQDSTGASIPELVEGMIPVKYLAGYWVKADVSTEWYNYANQQWANAVTVTESSRSRYQTAKPGTVIQMNDINTMWVWIPRYEYQYTNLGTKYAGGTAEQPGEIKINFISKEVNTPSSQDYKIHPAFTFGEKQLAGIWVGKFETTGSLEKETQACIDTNCDTSNVTIKPNLKSLKAQSISSFFYMARSMQLNNGTTFGFNSNSGDLHISKNSEWGSVAYLSQSKYGKYGNSTYTGANKEVSLNNCDQYITGIGELGNYPSSESCTKNTYDTATGQSASTTGNTTGIYDMVGGSFEYVMGNYNNMKGSSGFETLPESKYYDIYTTTNLSTACNGTICYGHALSETSGWYNDAINFITNSNQWMARGGDYQPRTTNGIFSSDSSGGYAIVNSTCRLILTP